MFAMRKCFGQAMQPVAELSCEKHFGLELLAILGTYGFCFSLINCFTGRTV